MLKFSNFIVFLLFFISSYAQLENLDDNYREDQIYFGVFYNSLINGPSDFNQNKFSSSISLGFIRDIPFNKERNFGLGLGLGLSTSSYHNNLNISVDSNNLEYLTIQDSDTFNKNKWALNEIEFPFEIRWRTSTLENYKFWRIYFGIKTSYIFSSKSVYESNANEVSGLIRNEKIRDLPFNKFQTGFTLNAGNNTWNLGLYLGLQPLFRDNFVENNQMIKNIKQFKVGLVFYIF
ncbi:MAG: outer membrane beta-barrel protein [Flavobacteriaceae bacterium]|nr:outer membrane beta-barrel protein [Flavobacteriaceae bacterium]